MPGGELLAQCQTDDPALGHGPYYFYHFDELGSTRAITHQDGYVVATYDYDAYGKVIHTTGSFQQPYQYVGQLGYYTHHQAPEFGWLQLGVRFYEPELGRFERRDPIRSVFLLYTYADSVPTVYVDPLGLCSLVFSGTKLKLFGDSGNLIGWVPAFSGAPGTGRGDVNKPIGPIPPGDYRIDPRGGAVAAPWPLNWLPGIYPDHPSETGPWGYCRYPIVPKDGLRSQYPEREFRFWYHGGTDIGSHGCIDVGPNERSFWGLIRRHCSGREIPLQVDYSGWYGRVPEPSKPWPSNPGGHIPPPPTNPSYGWDKESKYCQ